MGIVGVRCFLFCVVVDWMFYFGIGVGSVFGWGGCEFVCG